MDSGRPRKVEDGWDDPPEVAYSESDTVRCDKCLGAGFVRRDDLPVHHPAFGRELPCPKCGGQRARAGAMGEAAEYRAFLDRDHAEMARVREALGLPPLGATVSARTRREEGMEEPPPGFAKGGIPIPSTVGEEERERAKRMIARNVAAVAGKMRMGGER